MTQSGSNNNNTHTHSSTTKKQPQQPPPQHEEARWKLENSKEAKLMTVAPVALLAHPPTPNNNSRRGDRDKDKDKDGVRGDLSSVNR